MLPRTKEVVNTKTGRKSEDDSGFYCMGSGNQYACALDHRCISFSLRDITAAILSTRDVWEATAIMVVWDQFYNALLLPPMIPHTVGLVAGGRPTIRRITGCRGSWMVQGLLESFPLVWTSVAVFVGQSHQKGGGCLGASDVYCV